MRAPAPRAARAKPKAEEEVPIELAVDVRTYSQERSLAPPPPPAGPTSPSLTPPPRSSRAPLARPLSMAPAMSDLESDAHHLADFGDPPSTWILAPIYAWKVLRRQREIKAALAVRTAEAAHAHEALDDALVGFAERVRAVAETSPEYVMAVEQLGRAEETLRSRDRVLATEQDAQRARIAQVDVRIGRMEAELAQTQARERVVATELSAAQGALAREEAKMKRAEAELRTAQRDGGGGTT